LALARAVRAKLMAHRKIGILSSLYDRLSDIEEPGLLADAVAAHLRGKIEQKQEILEAADVITRLQKARPHADRSASGLARISHTTLA
jgi:ATP-dependent Lon protease